MRTLCAICTRLSMRVPAPMTVSSSAPRSTVVLAPISTSSSITTRPSCGTVWKPSGGDGEAEAVLADADAGIDVDPVADQRVRQRWHAGRSARRGRSPRRRRSPPAAPIRPRGPIDDILPDHRQRSDLGGRDRSGRRRRRPPMDGCRARPAAADGTAPPPWPRRPAGRPRRSPPRCPAPCPACRDGR